jgi:hypothetical protein
MTSRLAADPTDPNRPAVIRSLARPHPVTRPVTGYRTGYAIRSGAAGLMIGAALACGVTIGASAMYGAGQPAVIVCEAGTFEPADPEAETDDPYLRLTAQCTVTDAHGAPVTVLVID